MKKTRRIDLRLSNKDFAIIQQKAKVSDMTISEYIRTAALNKKVPGYKFADIKLDEQIPGQTSITDLIN